MRILKKILAQEVREPKSAPCEHVPPLFRTVSGRYVTITLAPVRLEAGNTHLPGAVWCTFCHWVKVTDEDYDYYRNFDGDQKS